MFLDAPAVHVYRTPRATPIQCPVDETNVQAAAAYDSAALRLKGAGAYQNFPGSNNGSGGVNLVPCSDEPQAKRARRAPSEDEEGEESEGGGSSLFASENREQLWAKVAENNAQIAAVLARVRAKRDARLAAQQAASPMSVSM